MLRSRASLALALALPAVLSSCVAVAAGAAGGAGVAYVMGEFGAELEATPAQVVQAGLKALGDLDITVLSSGATGVDGRIEARTSLDKKVSIEVERKDDRRSKIGIRVGTWGDEEVSRMIYERVKARL